MTKISINGFGRIGRNALRALVEKGLNNLDLVAINDPFCNLVGALHLFKYDSIFGRFKGECTQSEDSLIVNGKKIKFLQEKDPEKLPWKDLKVDIVLECSGAFTDAFKAKAHITAGARKVIISAPAKNEDATFVIGVNEKTYDPTKHHIISNASCTTNCLAPVVKVLNDNFGIEVGLMTTIHAYTNDQRLQDAPHKDLRRARAAAVSMIPTTTGAAKAIGLVLPELKGKLNGFAMRVPTINVSVVDFVAATKKSVTVEGVNNALKQAANSSLKGILAFTDEPLVSMDFLGDSHSSYVDGQMTMACGDKMVKVISWYDNEWGYSNRLIELAQLVGAKTPAACAA
ncbi:MAG: type I glyceraldehyde-3-phosphate dehydrogenase [Candidatus Melainabacteria bacterium]|nr:type I glyceraldehyde-3-phosphate dehydrogenase [Candidatus Melainabacteria bacterium]